jgi:diacylglycerol O-acyltransferase
MKQLGYTDSIFVSLETKETPQHIAFMGVYDPSTAPGGVVRFKDVMANFERRLNALPTFRTRLVEVPGRLDRPYWVVDDSFDVEYHVRHLALPQPGDWRQLCIQIARMHARPLDMKRPLWECNVIEGLNGVEGCPPGSFAVYVKIHHSMVDGDLGQRVLAVLHDMEPNPPPVEEESEQATADAAEEFKQPRLGDTELISRAFTNRVQNAPAFAKSAVELAKSVGDTVSKIANDELPMPASGPKTRFDEPVGPHRVVEAVEFSLPVLKEIKTIAGVTINDVCVAIVSGAMRKYLDHYGELPEESVIANVPVGLRKRGVVETDDNNQIAALMTRIHTEIADPIDRLHAVHDAMVDAKKFIDTPISQPLKIVGLFPPFMSKPLSRFYASAGLTKYLPAGTPCVITNVPGPRIDLYANGAKLVRMHLLGVLTPGVALFNAIFSLGDKLTITVLADRDIMPDPLFYKQCLEESFAELRDAVVGQPKPAPKKAAPRRKAAAKAPPAGKHS